MCVEVTDLDGAGRTATIKPMFVDKKEVVDFDFCIIAAGKRQEETISYY